MSWCANGTNGLVFYGSMGGGGGGGGEYKWWLAIDNLV